ncbi:MAG: folate family ECF transporter S component [Oscillospiraceae bacterium]|nr:folate family ECF transporter S component [Oscillospiraceae bacterium]
MSTMMRNQTLYPHPFSKAYWKDAASELKSTRMLVITALLIALRVALKPLAIPLGNPQLNIQTAMLATALGAMIFGPVVAIPAAIISDTIGFMIFPNGDYFLPFVLTEIASTLIYSLCLYRSKVSATRVMLARFLICFLVNMVLQTLIIAWQYTYMGNPEGAKNQILGIFTISRLFKNLFFFPIETVVLTLFLKVLTPVTYRAKLTFDKNADLRFTGKQIATLVLLVVVGLASAAGYLTYYYNTNSVTKEYSAEQVIERNKAMHEIITEKDAAVSEDDTVAVIESAIKPFLGKETTYTVALYQAVEGAEITDNMWSYKKTPASKDKNLQRIATVTIVAENKTDAVLSFDLKAAEPKK